MQETKITLMFLVLVGVVLPIINIFIVSSDAAEFDCWDCSEKDDPNQCYMNLFALMALPLSFAMAVHCVDTVMNFWPPPSYLVFVHMLANTVFPLVTTVAYMIVSDCGNEPCSTSTTLKYTFMICSICATILCVSGYLGVFKKRDSTASVQNQKEVV